MLINKIINLVSTCLIIIASQAIAAQKSTDLPPETAKPETAAVTPATPSADAKTLMASKSCMSCHAISQKIVGPAYHDVAERYRKNPKALETLMANIRSGGSGKWGPVPMPPFTTLSNEELKILAEFVLKQ